MKKETIAIFLQSVALALPLAAVSLMVWLVA